MTSPRSPPMLQQGDLLGRGLRAAWRRDRPAGTAPGCRAGRSARRRRARCSGRPAGRGTRARRRGAPTRWPRARRPRRGSGEARKSPATIRPCGRRSRGLRGSPRRKMAPPPRPVPHSTRSPCTFSTRMVSRHRSRWSRRTRPMVVYGNAASRSPESSRSLPVRRAGASWRNSFLRQAPGVAQLERRGHVRRARGTAEQVLDAHLVLEVVLVEQRALQQVEVAARGPLRSCCFALVEDAVLEHHRLAAASARPSSISSRRPAALSRCSSSATELGLAGDARLLDHDGQPEVDRQHEQAQRLVVLGDEVVDGRS